MRDALLRAAAVHPYERTDGGEESARRSSANPASAATTAADSGVQGACGRSSRELPVRHYSRRGKRGHIHGADKEPSAVTVPVLCAEAGPRHEVAFFEECICDLQ